jgi:phospholipid transport system substrate-binding protein
MKRLSPRNIILGLFLSLAINAQAAAAAQPLPEEVVRTVAGELLKKIGENKEEYRSDPVLLEQLVRTDLLPAMDVEYSARLILGRAGRGATEAQIKAFSDAMADVLIERYATGMLEYRNREQLEVLPFRGELNDRATRIRTRVRTLNGAQVPVDYMFRKTDSGWKAFDVIVEGISYVTTYRNQIMPQVQESGIEAVTLRLTAGELELKDQ